MGITPFLSIVTHCCNRSTFLRENIKSVKAQTSREWEQIYIVDRHQAGIKQANISFYRNRSRVRGEYVYILDDDCELINPQFIEHLHESVSPQDDIIMVRSIRPRGHPSSERLFPDYHVWGKTPKFETTNSLCYVIRADLWRAQIKAYGRGSGGDWWFLKGCMDTGAQLSWLNLLGGEAKQLGRGAADSFEPRRAGWFEHVAKIEKLENIDQDNWRLKGRP